MSKSLLAILIGSVLFLSGCDNENDDIQVSNPDSEEKHLFFKDRDFDLQAHRGGLGLRTESSIASFSNALEMGVTTLELDTQVTKDGKVVVTHDRQISKNKCLDTGPAFVGDLDYPYVGKYIKDLTLEQIKTMDCGSLRLKDYPQQLTSPGAKMLTIKEFFTLVKKYKSENVLMNIETKIEAGAPEQTAPREQFVKAVLDEVKKSGLENQITIQSFDWGALMVVKELNPKLPIIALTNGQQFLQVGQPGKSPWLGGLDIDDFNGDLIAAVKSFGADAVSPVHGNPQNGKIGDFNYVPYTTKEMVEKAHQNNLKVIPWTVSDIETINHLIGIGVDGVITDLPDVARKAMSENRMDLPDPIYKK